MTPDAWVTALGLATFLGLATGIVVAWMNSWRV